MTQIPIKFDRASDEPPAPRTYTVAQAVRGADRKLAQIGSIWVQGEISNLHRAGSGHAYFTLKDDEAALPTAMFRSAVQQIRFRLEEGAAVRILGRLGVYPAQGRFQFYGEKAEPVGLGERMLALERLKAKLLAEGLFEREGKRTLPRWPRRIGVVTSAEGAAVHDILKVVGRRFPSRILLSPARVQGDAAPRSLIDALTRLARQPDIDVIIIGRGGGSIEDLWAFNDEQLARAVRACPVPVISAVGHEVDVTVCDLVADLRAATPSQAGELVVADRQELRAAIVALRRRVGAAFERQLADERGRADRATHRLERAGQRLVSQQRHRFNANLARLERIAGTLVGARRRRLEALRQRLAAAHPRAALARDRDAIATLLHRLSRRITQRLSAQRLRFARAAGKLDSLSPLAVLERGYAVVTDANGQAVRDAAQLTVDAPLNMLLHRGKVVARVQKIIEGGDDE